jgi:ABC transport system ATP-binding/permease protein
MTATICATEALVPTRPAHVVPYPRVDRRRRRRVTAPHFVRPVGVGQPRTGPTDSLPRAGERAAQGGSAPLLSVRGLTVRHHRAPAPAVQDISFDVNRGEMLVVLGPSGSGKSTLCSALLGETEVVSGSASIAGRPITGRRPDAHVVSFVPQATSAFPELTVAQTMLYAAQFRLPESTTPAKRAEQIGRVLTQLDLAGCAPQLVAELSGGQRRRLSVALELITDPTLLILDEPTSGLDDGLDRRLMDDLASLARSGCTVVVVTHSTAHLHVASDVLALSAPSRTGHPDQSAAQIGYFGHPRELVDSFAGSSTADVMDALRRGETSQQTGTQAARSPSATPAPSARADHAPVRARTLPTFRTAFGVSLKRETLRLLLRPRWLANLSVIGPALATAVAAYGGLDGLAGSARHPNAHLGASMTVISVCLSFLAMALSLTCVVNDREVIRRERRWGVSPVAAVLARAASRLPAAVGQAATATAVLAVAGKLPAYHASHTPVFVGTFLILSALTVTSMFLGLLIGAIAPSTEHAVGTMCATLATMVILSGLVVPLGQPTGLQHLLSVVSDLTPTRWAIAGLGAQIDVGHITAVPPDDMWLHDPAHVLAPFAALLTMSLLILLAACVVVSRDRLCRGRRKHAS